MKNIIIILLLLSVFALSFFMKPIETFEKKNYDCIISINVHEKFSFLLKQLQNIKDNVKCKYAVILNCNEHMFNECKNNELPEDIYVYPSPLEKNTGHGSLTHGIYNNMVYALENFVFEFFIVTSSRSMFDNNMKLDNLKKLSTLPSTEKKPYTEEEYNGWWWPLFSGTMLFQYYKEQNLALHASAHEGLMFTENGCKTIVNFLEDHPEIKQNLFTYRACVEEFALQSICVNEGDTFYYIGNGCCSEEPIGHLGAENELFKFMYKTKREGTLGSNTFIRCAKKL
jgi:hypothetical protein